ncbi:MAG: ABC transporter permease [Pyrinomonadaceae bacterium]|nr:ABC transporter permease [Pyrinomonadaceae bacterium]
MTFAFRLALKYLRAPRKSLARFTTAAAVAGIAVGVAGLMIAQALSNGFADEIRKNILQSTPQITVSMTSGGEIFDWKKITNESKKNFENIRDIRPSAVESAALIGPNGTRFAVITVGGSEDGVTGGAPQIAVGEELAKETGASVGEQIDLVIFRNGEPERKRVRVEQVIKTGILELDRTRVEINELHFAQLTGQRKFVPTVLNIYVKDAFASSKTAGSLRETLGGGFTVSDWQTANEPLFSALAFERKVVFTIVLLIILIAALNITTTLALLVGERRLDIAVLRTCGATGKEISKTFLAEGAMIGAAGIAAGILIGASVISAANYFNLVTVPKEVYSISKLSLELSIYETLTIAAGAIIVCLAAAFLPAVKASGVKPLENLRRQ